MKVVFLGYFKIAVNGFLEAAGTEADSIIFTTNNPAVGWQGTGNYDVDPVFIDSTNYDFHLSENSPCIDAGTAFLILNGDTEINIPDCLYYGTAPD